MKSGKASRASEKRISAELAAMIRLHRLSDLSVTQGDLGIILCEIVDAAIDVADADLGTVQLIDPVSSALRIVAHRGFPEWWVDFWNSVPQGQGSCGVSLQRGERVIVENVEQSPIFVGAALEIQLKVGVRAVQSTPLVSRSGKLLGVFSTHYGKPQRPDEGKLRILDLLARQAADIIEHVRSIEMLREGEERFRSMADGVPLMIWVTDPEGNVRYINRAYAEFFGIKLEDLKSIGWQSLIHPDDFTAYAAEVTACLLDRRCLQAEVRVKRRDGEWRWVESFGQPRVSSSGEFLGMAGSSLDITDRKVTEEALRSVSAELRQTLHVAATGLNHCSRDLRYLSANPTYAQYVGVPLEQIIGRSIVEVIGKAAFETVRPRIERVLRGETVEYEDELPYPSGNKWMRGAYTPDRDASGNVVGWVASILDITERKRAEEALREREQRLRLALNASGAGFWTRDFRTDRVDRDDRFREIYGFTAGELVSFEAWLGRVHEEDRPQVLELWNQILHTKTQNTFDTTFRIVRPDGTVSWIQSLGQVHRDSDGQVMRLIGLELDVTERRRKEEALLSTETRFRELLEVDLRRTDSELRTILKAAPIGIVTMDREGKVTTWNDAAERIFGYSADEVVGRINAAIPVDALRGFREPVSRVLEGATIHTEGQQIKKDRSVIYVSLVRAPHYDEHGAVKGAITLVEDITEKRKAENDLARVRSALAEVQVEEARRIARDLHDDISQRLALLSFDIDRLLSGPPLSHEALLASLRSSRQKINDICGGLRDISHRMHPSVLEHLGLPNALQHLCDDFLQREGIPVKFHSDELANEIPRSIGYCLYRVAQEALHNISKHAKASAVHVNLAMAGKTIELHVTDSGVGFDTSKVTSGLGLESMRERVELVNGTFSVTSEPGFGTRIVVSVPLHELSATSLADRDDALGPDEHVERQTKKCRVLIGDDHPIFAAGVAKLLEETCDVAGTVGDGLALVEAAERLKPDLILIDISMPILNGFDAARRIRKSVPGAKLLFLTTHSEVDYADEAFKCGASGFLVKQAALSELPKAIAALLEGRTYRSAAIDNQARGAV
jgi:PAS domain S-box-containing protein